jgi:glycosyltransferase involved in cell wall biosynthesis
METKEKVEKKKVEKKNIERTNVTLLTSFSGGNAEIKVSGLSRYARSLYKEVKKKKFISEINVGIQQTREPPHWIQFLGKLVGKDTKTIFRAIPLTYPKTTTDYIHCTSQKLTIPLLYSSLFSLLPFSPRKKRKVIVTVHDIIPLATNQYKNTLEKITYFFIKLALKNAAHIIVDSEHTKSDIIKHVRYPKEKITVIYLGVDKKEFYQKKIQKQENTILYVGSDAKRKNIELIIKALAILKKEIPTIRFIKVGQAQDNPMRAKLKRLTEELNVTDHIVWKDYVENLADEYNRANMFVFPSLYEGFGFPVLEAMACGCPVITTKRASLSELAGDAALFIDGTSPQELAKKIKQLLRDKKLQKRLQKEGAKQAAKFTWEKCAEETIAVYKSVWGKKAIN